MNFHAFYVGLKPWFAHKSIYRSISIRSLDSGNDNSPQVNPTHSERLENACFDPFMVFQRTQEQSFFNNISRLKRTAAERYQRLRKLRKTDLTS